MTESCTFDTCCGCIELRTGCLIIGYLNLVGEIVLLVLGLLGLVASGVVATHGKDQETQETGALLIAASIIIIIIVLIFFIFTIVFLVGIHKNKRGHVKLYLIVTGICMVLYAIGFFVGLSSGNVQVGDVVSKIFSILLNIYFLLVIRSYYYKMDDTKRRPAIYSAP